MLALFRVLLTPSIEEKGMLVVTDGSEYQVIKNAGMVFNSVFEHDMVITSLLLPSPEMNREHSFPHTITLITALLHDSTIPPSFFTETPSLLEKRQ